MFFKEDILDMGCYLTCKFHLFFLLLSFVISLSLIVSSPFALYQSLFFSFPLKYSMLEAVGPSKTAEVVIGLLPSLLSHLEECCSYFQVSR